MGQIKNIKLHIVTDIKDIVRKRTESGIGRKMETENDSYDQYSRKRPLDASNDGYDYYKKPNNPFTGKPTLKFLVPNFMAGKLIGKGGSNIGELQGKFAASIQISPNREYYPGTTDRIVSIAASIDQIINFTNHLISLVQEEEMSERNNPQLKPEVRFIVSNIAAGLVIGKGGASIKAIQSSCSGARINLSKKEESVSGERVLIVSGDGPARISACKQIIEVMAAEPDKMSNSNLKYSQNNTNNVMQGQLNNHGPAPTFNHQDASSYNSFANNLANAMTNAMSSMGNRANSFGSGGAYVPKSGAKAKFQCEIEVPDKMVGTILGKGGQTIIEFGRNSGARLQFSGKDVFVPGTSNRILTITGSNMQQVQSAYALVDERLSQVEAEFDFPFSQQ